MKNKEKKAMQLFDGKQKKDKRNLEVFRPLFCSIIIKSATPNEDCKLCHFTTIKIQSVKLFYFLK